MASTELPDIKVNGILTCASDNVTINVEIGTLDDLAIVGGGRRRWNGRVGGPL